MVLFSFCLNALIAVLGVVGVVRDFAQLGWSMFQFYTLCSNVLLLLACAVQAGFEARILLKKGLFVPSWVRIFKYLAVCTTTVTFVGVVLILAPMAGGVRTLGFYLSYGTMLYHHTLCPLLGLASFVLLDRPALPDRRVTRWALIPTLIYAVVVTILNFTRTLYGPYPFLRVYEQPLWMSMLWGIVLLGMAWALAYLIWKLSLRFSLPHEVGPTDPEETAWTADGYIKNQDALSAYTYRTIPAGNNSCGPVSAFNLRRRAGQDARIADVLAEMDAMHLLNIPGPTLLSVMRRYLSRYLPGWRQVRGRDAALAAAERSRMGIIRYYEELVPHFVAYFRVGDGAFRFFNVSDDTEDAVLTMAAFGEAHLRGGSVILLCWE